MYKKWDKNQSGDQEFSGREAQEKSTHIYQKKKISKSSIFKDIYYSEIKYDVNFGLLALTIIWLWSLFLFIPVFMIQNLICYWSNIVRSTSNPSSLNQNKANIVL